MEKVAAAGTYHSKVHPDISITCGHAPDELAYIADVVAELQPRTIVELGAGVCGLTLAMREACPEAFIVAADIFCRPKVERHRVWEVFGTRTWFVWADVIAEHSAVVDFIMDGSDGGRLLYIDAGSCPDGRLLCADEYVDALTFDDVIGFHDVNMGVPETAIEEVLSDRIHAFEPFMPQERVPGERRSAKFWRVM